ncbi:hypothetical protein FA15DRAFT_603733 [Coprinopsis marcescibilis]|uniref:Uncharacterized protein n=1 Tax=Coprinopsis marcescibilis TaxID=230819 RepID=A0A5C3KDN7_COPMA|nr:hypothetical protein FA15DRAFT_603733 [Coprinopsis marcescibilis]
MAAEERGLGAGTRFVGLKRLQNRGLEYEVNTVAGVEWLHQEGNQKMFAETFGGETRLTGQGYKVEIHHVSTHWLQKESELYALIEGENGMGTRVIADGRWRWAPKYWREGQCTAHMMLVVMEAKAANVLIEKGIRLDRETLGVFKPEPEPK